MAWTPLPRPDERFRRRDIKYIVGPRERRETAVSSIFSFHAAFNSVSITSLICILLWGNEQLSLLVTVKATRWICWSCASWTPSRAVQALACWVLWVSTGSDYVEESDECDPAFKLTSPLHRKLGNPPKNICKWLATKDETEGHQQVTCLQLAELVSTLNFGNLHFLMGRI